MEPTHHAVVIDQSKVQEGENTFVCTLCQQPLVLVATRLGEEDQAKTGGKLYAYSLREEDANNPAMGGIKIEYTEG